MGGLLGMLAAGAGRGAADASQRMYDQEQAMKFEMGREELRMKYLDREMSARNAAAMERDRARSESAMIREDMKAAKDKEKYEREREGKLSDAEIAHKRAMEREGFRQSRMDSRALLNKSAGKSEKGILLSDGSYYMPMSPQGKLAVDLINAKKDPKFADSFYEAETRALVGQAANSIQGLSEGTVPTAKNMVRELYQPAVTQQERMMDVMRDPKTGALILKK